MSGCGRGRMWAGAVSRCAPRLGRRRRGGGGCRGGGWSAGGLWVSGVRLVCTQGTREDGVAYIEFIVVATEAVEKKMPVHLSYPSACPPNPSPLVVGIRTCGLIKTKSMNSTTKSCSTYLSANFLQRGHCVRRTPLPSARSSAFEYSVYSVFTG